MSIEFNVRCTSPYNELTISAGLVSMSSGLLDRNESVKMAQELIYAAERLLPAEQGEAEAKLCEIREVLINQAAP